MPLSAFAETSLHDEKSFDYSDSAINDLDSVILERDIDGNYVGEVKAEITTNGVVMATAISFKLYSGTGGIPNLYHMYVKWVGTSQVANIKADALTVSNLSGTKYYSKDFSVNCGAAVSGTAPVGGAFIIPTSVKQVRVKTTNLRLYYNVSSWVWVADYNYIHKVNY